MYILPAQTDVGIKHLCFFKLNLQILIFEVLKIVSFFLITANKNIIFSYIQNQKTSTKIPVADSWIVTQFRKKLNKQFERNLKLTTLELTH